MDVTISGALCVLERPTTVLTMAVRTTLSLAAAGLVHSVDGSILGIATEHWAALFAAELRCMLFILVHVVMVRSSLAFASALAPFFSVVLSVVNDIQLRFIQQHRIFAEYVDILLTVY